MSTGVPMLGRRTYLDTNLYIYVFEGIETYRTRMVELLSAIDREDVTVIASELLFTEILPRPVKDGRQDLVERYLDLIRRTPRISLVPVDRSVILRSVHLRADFGLRSMDALHLATALVHGLSRQHLHYQRPTPCPGRPAPGAHPAGPGPDDVSGAEVSRGTEAARRGASLPPVVSRTR